ncbi:sigma-70 family RNA polymerase sigma factor [bacterium]|nr:sigma-70 family RNA polymerase sigma factor [bacterium]
MRRYAQGDEAAFAQLVERHYASVYHYIHRFFSGRVDAEDLAQDVFLKVVRSARQYRVKARFTTWLFRIAHNTCIDHHRRQSRLKVVSAEAENEEGEVDSLLERMSDGAPPASRRVLSRELLSLVQSALLELPEEQRTVFVLREEMGLPFEEVARVLGCNVNTAKSRMRYALERLAASLRRRDVTEEVLAAYAL